MLVLEMPPAVTGYLCFQDLFVCLSLSMAVEEFAWDQIDTTRTRITIILGSDLNIA